MFSNLISKKAKLASLLNVLHFTGTKTTTASLANDVLHFSTCKIKETDGKEIFANQCVTLHFLRHGEATHNVNAESMRRNGCSYEKFIAQMAEDDEVDANLTERGKQQAKNTSLKLSSHTLHVQAIVSSPLSRALTTANIVFENHLDIVTRVCLEDLREHNGLLLNGKRRSKDELAKDFPEWNFDDLLPGQDKLWSKELESIDSVAERGYNVLHWIWDRRKLHSNIAIAGHGSLFHQLLNNHKHILADDELRIRFENCELRQCIMTAIDSEERSIWKLSQIPN